MATKSFAYTAPVNPPGTTQPLTAPQLWAALQLKIRKPQLFVPDIAACTVLSDSDSRVERDAFLKAAPDKAMREVITWDAGSLVEFVRVGDGSKVTNLISRGDGGELFLTYGFHLAEAKDGMDKMAPGAVKGTIEAARRMVQKGEI